MIHCPSFFGVRCKGFFSKQIIDKVTSKVSFNQKSRSNIDLGHRSENGGGLK